MMQILSVTILLGNCELANADFNSPPSSSFQPAIPWVSDYQAGIAEAQKGQKALVLFFTGSDWCSWCHRLEDEVLNQKEFGQALKDKFVFVKVDFPMKTKLPPEAAAQNQQLRNRFGVNSFPTLVILDGKERVLGTTGYRPGGAVAFADYLSSIAARKN